MKLRILSALLLVALLLSMLCGCVTAASDRSDASQSGTLAGANTQNSSSHSHTTTSNSHSHETQSPNDKEPIVPGDSKFEVHFIDVGQADSILVICDGKTMLIDGGNVADSSLVYTYLQKNGIRHLDYVVCTHAHEDHVGGLSGALSYATAGTVYSPVRTYTTKAFSNFVQKVEIQGKKLTIPKAGSSFSLGEATVSVLGPLKEYEDPNNTSIVLRVVYGELSFLFTGDMERDAELDLIEAGINLSATVLKVGHHGSSTSTSYRFLKEVAPKYAVISVGEDNDYNHPHDAVLSRLRDADVKLYRTDLQGDVICTSRDGKTLNFVTRKNLGAVTNPTEGEGTQNGTAATEYSYIGNLKSKIYHKVTCTGLPALLNRIYFIEKNEAESAGYTPCKNCKP